MSEWAPAASYRAAPPREQPRRVHSYEVRYRKGGDIDVTFRLADGAVFPLRFTKADMQDLWLATHKGRRRR